MLCLYISECTFIAHILTSSVRILATAQQEKKVNANIYKNLILFQFHFESCKQKLKIRENINKISFFFNFIVFNVVIFHCTAFTINMRICSPTRARCISVFFSPTRNPSSWRVNFTFLLRNSAPFCGYPFHELTDWLPGCLLASWLGCWCGRWYFVAISQFMLLLFWTIRCSFQSKPLLRRMRRRWGQFQRGWETVLWLRSIRTLLIPNANGMGPSHGYGIITSERTLFT